MVPTEERWEQTRRPGTMKLYQGISRSQCGELRLVKARRPRELPPSERTIGQAIRQAMRPFTPGTGGRAQKSRHSCGLTSTGIIPYPLAFGHGSKVVEMKTYYLNPG